MRGHAYLEADWRREALRTNLWVVPVVQTLAVLSLFAAPTGRTVRLTTD
jgi:hypothetical protein